MVPSIQRVGQCLVLAFALASAPGCGILIPDLSEQSNPMIPERLIHVADVHRLSTRDWVPPVQTAMAPLLPPEQRIALTTAGLSAGDAPRDIMKEFDLRSDHLDNLFLNVRNISFTAGSASVGPTGSKALLARPGWPGFHEVTVPVSGGAFLSARLGDPDQQYEIPGSYIIITHGLFGSLDGAGVLNQVQALRRAGHHVLAIEMRGHGQTQAAHREYAMTFGLSESADFLAAARWLKQSEGATRVGLVSFSLTGYEALLTAWLDGTAPVSEFQGCPLNTLLPSRQSEPAFNAGMFVISAPVNVIDVASRFDTRYTPFTGPIKWTFGNLVENRVTSYQFPPAYSMWDLARCEFLRSPLSRLYTTFEDARPDFTRFLDLSAQNWQVGAARMANIRVPVLLLNAASDPLETGQSVADLFSRQHNPNIGVILLKDGGHIGFTASCPDYYYCLMTNFFDPATAPAVR